MIPVRHALLVMLIACWDCWRLLVGRIDDGSSAVAVIALGLCGVMLWRRLDRDAQVPVWPVAILLTAYAAATVLGTALIQIGIAVAGIVMILNAGPSRRAFPFPATGLALLLLPIMPTLDFFAAWPMRRVSAMITAGMLQMNGFAVSANGVALDWQGKLLLFDGPCSGVHMLRAALVLTSALALIARLSALRYALAMAATAGLAILANALRASSLFYVESGFVPRMEGPVFHELVGIASFAMLCALLIAAFHWIEISQRKVPSCA
jgi:exosortase/archaeosortase family protein